MEHRDIPEDLARPRDTERGRLIANLTVATLGLVIAVGMLVYALVTVTG